MRTYAVAFAVPIWAHGQPYQGYMDSTGSPLFMLPQRRKSPSKIQDCDFWGRRLPRVACRFELDYPLKQGLFRNRRPDGMTLASLW